MDKDFQPFYENTDYLTQLVAEMEKCPDCDAPLKVYTQVLNDGATKEVGECTHCGYTESS